MTVDKQDIQPSRDAAGLDRVPGVGSQCIWRVSRVRGTALARLLIRSGGSGGTAGRYIVDEADRRGTRQESATSDEKELMAA
ncbi:hypothetical protein G6038_09855 [Rhodococcus sp. 14C212]|uniref:hypothetical protein n=1 Tax=Rhodococcus sp. 14C212 TaxID=2711209 RepID=UPI0013EBD0E1|nr:hypothetical protein [Rhodococcus sp. 14C212]NGP05777.1 hypothetical protein [Rhodococcus sp. 14C212]